MKPFFMVYKKLDDSLFLGLAIHECDTFVEAKAELQRLRLEHPEDNYVVMRAIQTEPAPVVPKEVKLLPPPAVEQPLTRPMPV